ncbi:MAG: trypsin-like serine protease [Bdellovibrionota bacterium]
MKFIAISIIFLFIQTSYANPKLHNKPIKLRIVGGTEVKLEDLEAKSTVSLRRENGGLINNCTGTLIHKRLVLTAAHCVANHTTVNVENLYVGFGLAKPSWVDSSDSEVKFVTLETGRIHPEYTTNGVDIALIKLSQDAPKGWKPVEIESDASVLKKGTEVILAGYGLRSYNPLLNAGSLYKVTVKIAETEKNAPYLFNYAFFGGGGCQGDSGGPGYIQDGNKLKLLGVISGGDRDCLGRGFLSSVPYVAEWISKMAVELIEEGSL